MKQVVSKIAQGHPDFEALSRVRDAILEQAGGVGALTKNLPKIIQDAVDFVVDPARTARTRISDLDKVEKTFIGLKIEHYFRDLLDVPAGLRDLRINDTDVDIKNTVRATWMIPPETYRSSDPVVLIATAEDQARCWLGLMLARPEYLNRPNRDQKRSVSARAFENILWLVDGEPLPESRWHPVDMNVFRELRMMKGGTKRAAAFFRAHPGIPLHRSIVQALLHDQRDYMKRLRGNGGARDLLSQEGIALLSGAYDQDVLKQLGHSGVESDEIIAVHPSTKSEHDLLHSYGVIV